MRGLQVVWLWAICVVGLSSARESVSSESHYGSWAACQGAVCSEVQRQAEGLTRLKLLRNYVVQTMHLMDSLVTSLDEELVNTGEGLAVFIGQRCEAAHPLLQHVTKPQVSVDRLNNIELQEDLDASERSHVASTLHVGEEIETEENEIEQSTGSDYRESEYQIEASSSHSSTSVSSSTSSVSGQATTNKNIGKQLKKASASKHGHYVDPSQSGGREAIHGSGGTGSGFGGGSHGSGSTGSSFSSGGTGSGFGSGSHSSSSGFKGESHGSSGTGSGIGGGSHVSGGSGSGFGGGSTSSGGAGSGCRGVSRGSPWWTPGLDVWCAINCAAGYCPSTHCVCEPPVEFAK